MTRRLLKTQYVESRIMIIPSVRTILVSSFEFCGVALAILRTSIAWIIRIEYIAKMMSSGGSSWILVGLIIGFWG